MNILKKIIPLVFAPLPSSLKKLAFRYFLGHQLAKNSYIGFSIVITDKLILQENARIGHLNFIKGLELLSLSEYATIDKFNWITGFSKALESKHFQHKKRHTSLILNEHSALTSRHIIDCTDKIEIGAFSTIAGYRSQFLTHSVDLKKSIQDCAPISIGRYCFIGTQTTILPGAKIPSYSIVAANSVIKNPLTEEYSIYAGNPAVKINSKPINDYKYFHRNIGYID
jgi:acetyltransferase-like isoleucine patch superfamily enzyme